MTPPPTRRPAAAATRGAPMRARHLLIGVAGTALAASTATSATLTGRLVVSVTVGLLLTLGVRHREIELTAAGLLGLVLLVATGPAATAGAVGLLAWAVPTWALVFAAAAAHDPRPRPRDGRARLLTVRGELLACLAAAPLVVVVTASGGLGLQDLWLLGALGAFGALVAIGSRVAGTRRAGSTGASSSAPS